MVESACLLGLQEQNETEQAASEDTSFNLVHKNSQKLRFGTKLFTYFWELYETSVHLLY